MSRFYLASAAVCVEAALAEIAGCALILSEPQPSHSPFLSRP